MSPETNLQGMFSRPLLRGIIQEPTVLDAARAANLGINRYKESRALARARAHEGKSIRRWAVGERIAR